MINYIRAFYILLKYENIPQKIPFALAKYFGEPPIAEITPILGTRNVNSLQRQFNKNKVI